MRQSMGMSTQLDLLNLGKPMVIYGSVVWWDNKLKQRARVKLAACGRRHFCDNAHHTAGSHGDIAGLNPSPHFAGIGGYEGVL